MWGPSKPNTWMAGHMSNFSTSLPPSRYEGELPQHYTNTIVSVDGVAEGEG